MNTNFSSLWFDPTGNRTRVYRFSSRRSIHLTTRSHSIHSTTDRSIHSTRVYRFSPRKRKTNVILTLTHRALAICSPERLPSELDKIKFILQTDGYPEHVIKSFMAKKMKQFHALPKFGPEKCPDYLRFQWLGSVSTRFEKQVKSAVKQCFSAVEPRVAYSINELLSATNKDVLPALRKSNVIYQFSCHCDSRYEGRTSQRQQDRIKQHVPKSIRSCSPSQNASFLLVGTNFPPRPIPSLLPLTQSLDSSFAKSYPRSTL